MPRVTSVAPSSVEYNETPSTSVRVTGQFFYEPPPGSPSSDPSYVTVGTLVYPCVLGAGPATSGTPCVHIDRRNIDFYWPNTALAPGAYTVQVTNPAYAGAESGGLANAFTVTAPQPQIQPNGIRPLAVAANITPPRVVDVAGVDDAANHFGFVPGATLTLTNTATTASVPLVCNAGTVPSASARCVFVGPGLLRFFWDTAFLGVGSYDVTVVNPASRGGLATPEPGRFRVTALPELINVAPSTVGSGARSAVVELTTAGFPSGSVVRIGVLNASTPPYVDTQDVQVTMRSAFRAFASGDGGTVVIDVAEDQAQPADRLLWVTITSADGQYRFTCPDPANGAETCTSGLTITPPPVVTAITPALGVGASNRTLSIAGDRFVAPGTTVTLPTGITGTCPAANATTINCTGVAVAATVAPGDVSVIVTNPDGGRTTGTLTINGPPVISSVTPASGTAGASLTVRVLGSGFQAGLLQPEFGDITVNSFQRIDAATVDINITIPPGAADGYRSLTTTNPDGGAGSAPQAFYVGTLPSDTAQVLATFGEQGESLVQYRRSLGQAWGTQIDGPILSSPPVWQVMKANPTRDERLLAVVDDQRRLTVHVWNGQTWANALAAASSTGLARPSQTVDVAFEQQSGRGVVVYATSDSTTLRYRLWDGTAWSAEAFVEDLVNGQQTTGRPLWVRLEARPTTNDLVLVYGDQNNAIAAAVWRGNRNQWEDSVLLTNAAASHEAPIFDIAFERATGRAMVVWATGSETTPHYRIWSRDASDVGGWQAEDVAPSLGVTTGQPIRALRAVGDGSNGAGVTNRIVLVASTGSAAPALVAVVWDGVQWSASTQVLTPTLRAQDGVRGFDVVSQGANGNFLAVYATTANPNGVSRTYAMATGAWSTVETDVALPASGSPALSFPAWTELASSRGINDVALSQFDTLGRVLLARWNGAVWSAATEAQSSGSGLVGAPPVAGKSVAVTLAQHLRGLGPAITPPSSIADGIPPGTPTLSAGTATITTVPLSWAAVGDDGTGGGRVLRYELRMSSVSSSSVRNVMPTQDPGGTETLTVSSLSAGTSYAFDIRAIDDAGNVSAWSNAVTVTTVTDQPPPAVSLTVAPGSPPTANSIAIQWTEPSDDSGPIDGYQVRYTNAATFDFDSAMPYTLHLPTVSGGNASLVIDGLVPNTTYRIGVKAIDAVGQIGSLSNVLAATTTVNGADITPPAAVTDLAVFGGATTSNSLLLQWTATGDDGTAGVASAYEIRYATIPLAAANFSQGTLIGSMPPGQPGTAQELPVRGLMSNTTYYFGLRVIDDGGNPSLLSNVVIVRTALRSGYTIVSVPLLLSPPNNTPDVVFGDDVGLPPYAYHWLSSGPTVADGCYTGTVSQPAFPTCAPLTLIQTGSAYYLYAAGTLAVLDAAGTPVAAGTFEVDLVEGFNMVGNPYGQPISLADVSVRRASTVLSFAAAVAQGWVGGAMYLYDGAAFQAYGPGDPAAVFHPWNGAWIESRVADAVLIFAAP
ncbi:MAG: fibronectin type III domain-containing protein [Nitrospirota bacterium]